MKSYLNPQRRGRSFPLTDFSYHVAAMPRFHGDCARRAFPSFCEISRPYFRKEARAEFRQEFAAFAAIVATTAVPLLSSMQALVHLVLAIGHH